MTDLVFIDGLGRRVGRINVQALQGSAGSREVELPRGDLATILAEASRDHAEFIFGDSIATLSQEDDGVTVAFDYALPRRFDLVIGADGLHSTVRRLALGPESKFVEHMGIYVATVPLDGSFGSRHEVLLYNTPGRLVTIHPGRDRALAAFMFRSPELPDFDHRDTDQHKRLLAAAFVDASWRAPELLEQALKADDLFFDSVSRVRLSAWSVGRVALVGDAASCVSLFGDGSSLAIAGAFTLAEELAASAVDNRLAFERYETRHRSLVEPRQRNIEGGAWLLLPRTQLAITVRNLATRLWPIAAAAGRLSRGLSHA